MAFWLFGFGFILFWVGFFWELRWEGVFKISSDEMIWPGGVFAKVIISITPDSFVVEGGPELSVAHIAARRDQEPARANSAMSLQRQ